MKIITQSQPAPAPRYVHLAYSSAGGNPGSADILAGLAILSFLLALFFRLRRYFRHKKKMEIERDQPSKPGVDGDEDPSGPMS